MYPICHDPASHALHTVLCTVFCLHSALHFALHSALHYVLHSALHFCNHILYSDPNLIHTILYASASHFLAQYFRLVEKMSKEAAEKAVEEAEKEVNEEDAAIDVLEADNILENPELIDTTKDVVTKVDHVEAEHVDDDEYIPLAESSRVVEDIEPNEVPKEVHREVK